MARKIVNGKAVVSAKELEASGLSLRDFLNKEQGLTRKAPEGTKFGVSGPRNPSVKDDSQVVKREGAKPAAPAPAPAPKPQASEKSLLDKYRESDTAKGFRDARATFGDTPSTDMLMKAGQVGIGMGIGKLLGPAGSAVGAVVKRALKEEVPESFLARENNPSFNPEKMVDRSRAEHTFNPDKMVDRRSTTFPGRTEQKFNPDKMTGRDRPEPEFKKGGKVSSASSRGDGIAQRGKTKGRMC